MIWALLIHHRLTFIFLLFMRQLNKKHRINIYLPFILSRNNIIKKSTKKPPTYYYHINVFIYGIYINVY